MADGVFFRRHGLRSSKTFHISHIKDLYLSYSRSYKEGAIKLYYPFNRLGLTKHIVCFFFFPHAVIIYHLGPLFACNMEAAKHYTKQMLHENTV